MGRNKGGNMAKSIDEKIIKKQENIDELQQKQNSNNEKLLIEMKELEKLITEKELENLLKLKNVFNNSNDVDEFFKAVAMKDIQEMERLMKKQMSKLDN